ncbi:hypothetical protein H4582DRAFT_2088275 [Lactarius indigo]|nr:hypothetical protein H4582DRAFT_2088275 [Lactarius indigo]
MSSSEHIPSPAPQRVPPLSSGPPLTSSRPGRPAAKWRAKSNRSHPAGVDLSVFDILNTFHRRWFLSRPNLLANTISAQKVEDGNISWVEFSPPYHSHLVKSAVALVPHPVHTVKKVMFVYILEFLNREGNLAFFELQKGLGRKANNSQKEKGRLARKRSRAAKREREREAAKAANLPPCERQCDGCGRKFETHKTAKWHKCTATKVMSVSEEFAMKAAEFLTRSAKPNKPAAIFLPHWPTDLTNRDVSPPVTGDSREEWRWAAVPPGGSEASRWLPSYQEWAAEWEKRRGDIRAGHRVAGFADLITLTKPSDGNNHPLWLAETDCERDGRGGEDEESPTIHKAYFERHAFSVVKYGRVISCNKHLSSNKKNAFPFLTFLQETRALSRREPSPYAYMPPEPG